ncbi:uncharacterized protein B0H64DRAFT_474602 [Chaetomium fimeti]|uniref:Uncharacterized protein n=1 Tax=Chaetomium fimeti TaxID=1854472 RepID=A0AAE0HHC3_9PEZI|nr:hypothetical protein B0H64DRAFT_474602 [Chaetomium fimeti]
MTLSISEYPTDDSDDQGNGGLPNSRDGEAGPSTGVRPPSRPEAEEERQQPPEEVQSSGSDDDDGIVPWEYVTGESRAWILSVEGSYGSDFRWCRMQPPSQESHCQAMCHSSPFKKGIFYDPAGPPLRPTYLGHTPTSTVVVSGNPEWFALPFFHRHGRSFFHLIEPHCPFDPRGLVSNHHHHHREVRNTPQHHSDTLNALVAAMIYLCGQVRLGDRQCVRCRRRRITTTIPGEAIPVCATAGRYFHGVCANCLAAGGTLAEMLDRCSVSGRLSPEEYRRLSRGLGEPGWVGRSPFIGDDAGDLAFARNLLWRKALPPPAPRRSPGTAAGGSSSSQNATAVGGRENVIASSLNPEAARRPNVAMDRNRDTATTSSPSMTVSEYGSSQQPNGSSQEHGYSNNQ